MVRLTYISKFSRHLAPHEIEAIETVSVRNNREIGVTGVLLAINGYFFQIIEGAADTIDRLYAKIGRDDRHADVLCLLREQDCERQYPEWNMRLINLEESGDAVIQTVKALLRTVTDSHRILEKYTQPTILKMIRNGINPLGASSRQIERIVLFSDVMAFSTMCEKLEFDAVRTILNHFHDVNASAIAEHGGEVAKLIGDGLMAYFPADRADDAIHAGLEILAELDRLRAKADPCGPVRLLYAGIGLSRGMVVEGNIGSRVKMDYTILGDAVNTAARLESLTRQLPYSLLFSADVKAAARFPWDFAELGTHALKGKDQTIAIFSVHESVARRADAVRVPDLVDAFASL